MNDRTSEPDPELDVDWWASRLVDREVDFADVPIDLRAAVQERSTSFAVQRRSLLRSGTDHTVDTSITNAAVSAALRSPDTATTRGRSRLVPLLAMAAASVGVIAVGATILQPDDSPEVIAVESADVIASVDVVREAKIPTTVDAEPVDDQIVPESESAAAMAVDDTTAASTTPDLPTHDEATNVVEIADLADLSEIVRSWIDVPPPFVDGTSPCVDDQGRRALAISVRFAGIDVLAYFSAEAGVTLLSVSDCSTIASIVP